MLKVALKLKGKCYVAWGCYNWKKLLRRPKVAKKLPSTIGKCLIIYHLYKVTVTVLICFVFPSWITNEFLNCSYILRKTCIIKYDVTMLIFEILEVEVILKRICHVCVAIITDSMLLKVTRFESWYIISIHATYGNTY